MTTEKWIEFSDTLTHNLNLHKTPLDNFTEESIDTTWHKIEHSIINTSIHSIPNKKTRKRCYNHQYTPHCTSLHLSLKELGHIIKTVKHTQTDLDINFINTKIQKINFKAKCNLPPLTTDSFLTWINIAQNIWKQIYHARHLENSLLLRQQIQQASEKRCETLSTRPTQAINSILNRYQPPIHFSNIKLPDQLITDSHLIKQHIQSHFLNWTAYRPINNNLFDNFWSTHYYPLTHINTQWYTSLTSNITEDEVLQTIMQLPNGKACGPTGISYEMLKHAGPTCIKALTALFNRCLTLGQVSKQ